MKIVLCGVKSLNVFVLIIAHPAAQIVKWSPAGDKYIVVVNDKLDVYDLESASVIGSFTYRRRISSVRFLKVCFWLLT